MTKGRMEAFSDGVIAILITIMVLELKVPEGADAHALRGMLPGFLSYLLSFIYLGIYWVNHHHMVHTADHINGRILWANLHLLFWLSLVPSATAWMGDNHTLPIPTAVYGAVLLMPAIAYYVLQQSIIAAQGPHSRLHDAIGRDYKGKLSPVLYASSIGLAFVRPWMADVIFVLVALMWLVPDPRIESRLG
ncbi:TMEM175 family protein [Longimicrobium sp.]|uniref:TMEM175 family protein n=1 Tax=Longimicrobium sp. TaxID=2029185 RepID=UPI002C3B7C86|nr:TMEM175 family protein [Longimicrobium sp.]HSU16429.1 TMEM175 family protein [Longimicrobium sp.]